MKNSIGTFAGQIRLAIVLVLFVMLTACSPTARLSPNAQIATPSDGASLNWDDYFDGVNSLEIPVTGTGTAGDNSPISGARLAWSWKIAGATSWNENVATGNSAVLQIPLLADRTFYDIRLVATDGSGLTGVDIVSILVIGPPS